MLTIPYRFIVTLLGVFAVLLAALGQIGCTSTERSPQAHRVTAEDADASKFQKDRAAILGMAGEYDVSFEFEETVAIRPGYELAKPYQSNASELVLVIEDAGTRISLQHLLVVKHGEETHIVKHWRQDWQYQATAGFDYQGENLWQPMAFDQSQAQGAWVQSVYQVDDSPRYWGIGRWEHRDGVSTWSAPTHRPLPRREHTKRSDYQVLGAVNTHVVTDAGWMHYQSNHKLDKHAEKDRVIALESGVNTYAKTTETDFSAAREYWEKTAAYWAQVRAAWAKVYDQQQALKLKRTWKGDKMYTHFFDLADLYWGQADASDARAKIDSLIQAFRETDAVALP